MHLAPIKIRCPTLDDLDAINRVVEQAIMGWNLPDRVKRLALPSYRYSPFDLNHMEVRVAEESMKGILGLTAWEPADRQQTPNNLPAHLLHGIFVLPTYQHQGIGGRLLEVAEEATRAAGCKGILVKAQADAVEFFRNKDYHPLEIKDTLKDYANRYWKSII